MPDSQLLAANQLFLKKQFQDAIKIYDQILQINPQNIDAINNKGYSLGKLKLHQEAIACYDFGLRLYPNEKTLLINKISSLRKTKQNEQALVICNQVLESHPNDNITMYHMERIFAALARYSESISCCDKILESYPSNSEVLFDKATALAQMNSPQMIEFLIAAIKADSRLKIKAKNHSAFEKYNSDQEFLRVVS